MNSLPVEQQSMEWVISFKTALEQLLYDVDRLALFVNTTCPLSDTVTLPDTIMPPETVTVPGILIAQGRLDERPDNLTLTAVDTNNQKLSDAYLHHMEQGGFPFHEYQEPHTFLYFMPPAEHLGTIILFRRRGATPISSQTLETVEQLRPFFIVALSSRVTREAYLAPGNRMFTTILLGFIGHLCLTPREKEILSLRLMGLQIKIIADKLTVSENAVKKHIARILRKAGARNVRELFMRYLLPHRDLPDDLWLSAITHSPGKARRRGRTTQSEQPMAIRTTHGHLLW